MLRFFLLFFSVSSLQAALDLNGDGVSDLWNLQFEIPVVTDLDSDNDGVSDREEAIAGTDPSNANSFLQLSITTSTDEVSFQWPSVEGKQYEITKYDVETELWTSILVSPPGEVSEARVASIPIGVGGIFRLEVRDVDLDGDGLDAWEEIQLGFNDENPRGSGDLTRSDFSVALRQIESENGVTLSNGSQIPQKLPSPSEAARFLLRASFGPTSESISELQELGFSGWLDKQINLPRLTLRRAMSQNRIQYGSSNFRHALWRANITAEDQLRHRMANALSQIFVISTQGGSVVGDNIFVQAKYYDIFVDEAFDSYREILEKVTYSPVMGSYLSHLKNRKSDPSINRFPDENFAREIMQLFTIGLWELNMDGSRKLDSEGNFIPTYDNSVITEMAKVFTGMSFTTVNNGSATATSFYAKPAGNDYLFPMKVWPTEHEPGPKQIIGGVTLDGTQTGEEEVQATLDALIDNPNTAPFVSRLFIQRFTTSNPSSQYLRRVAEIFSGPPFAESKGNLGAMIEAILLDPENLTPNNSDPFYGKLREPIISFLHMMRILDYKTESGNYLVDSNQLLDEFGQFPTLAPSVFNFYLPDFSPVGEFRNSGKYAPEFQIATTSQILSLDSRFSSAIDKGYFFAQPDFTDVLTLADDPEALIDHLDLIFTANQLLPETKEAILAAVVAQPDDLSKIRTAIHLVTQSPESLVLK